MGSTASRRQDRRTLERATRRVFHAIHVSQGKDAAILRRLSTMITPDYLKVPKGFFKGKACLDAGCGSNASVTRNLLELGAAQVHALDLDSSFLATAPRRLRGFEGRYKLDVGSVLDLPYPDGTFDFVFCGGVLHHTADPFRGLRELGRVTKRGGMLHLEIYGKGGLLRDVTSLLRRRYRADSGFKRFIEDLSASRLRSTLRWVLAEMARRADPLAGRVPMKVLHELFDQDLVLTVKDRLQAPAYREDSEEEVVSELRRQGFSRIERLSRYPRYGNIRRFLSPLYNDYRHPLARLLYGSGLIQLKAVKARR
ncbi:MAG: class I SAM-dependent methyltransferase [Elusimicrobia bacterium]|nr:class I SAM-dependent methyltransferase [Elusimicrobiota bacterium]